MPGDVSEKSGAVLNEVAFSDHGFSSKEPGSSSPAIYLITLKRTWPVLGEDPAAGSRRVDQFIAP